MTDHRANGKRPANAKTHRVRSPIVPGRVPQRGVPANGGVRSRWLSWSANVGPVWRFGLRFAGLMILFYVVVLTPFCDRLLYAYLTANAGIANAILNWLGQDSHVSEITIRSARFAISVRRGCDAIEPSWFFCAALISFPAPLGRKLLGVVAGAALLQALNLVRIVSLYFIGICYPRFFAPAHLEIWPATFIVIAILLWIKWINWTKRPTQPELHAVA